VDDPSLETYGSAHQLSQLSDADVLPATDIDWKRASVALEKRHTGVGEVVDVQKLSPGGACSPDHHLGRTTDLRVMRLADEGRQDMRRLEIEIVTGSVEIGRLAANEIGALLFAIGLAELDSSDLGYCVPLVGGLQRPP